MLAELIYEDIKAVHKTYTFGRAKYGEFGVVVIKENGYINATDLCSQGNKEYCKWSRLDTAISLFKEVAIDTGIPITDLAIKVCGNQTHIKGTYIHPLILMPLSVWISPSFSVKVSRFIIESGKVMPLLKGFSETLKPKQVTIKTEKRKQLKLAKELKGFMEISTPVGIIDILTFDEIIEVKEASLWKHALGQIISYGLYYPINQKVIYLFGRVRDLDLIRSICQPHNVEVRLC